MNLHGQGTPIPSRSLRADKNRMISILSSNPSRSGQNLGSSQSARPNSPTTSLSAQNSGISQSPRPKHPGGRPTTYKPEYCQQLLDAARDGYSLTAFAGLVGICYDVVNEWANVHPEFGRAVKNAKALRSIWWQDIARNLAANGGTGGQVAMCIFMLKNYAPHEFKDRQELDVSGKITLEALLNEMDGLKTIEPTKTIEGEFEVKGGAE